MESCMTNILRAASQYGINTSRLPYLLHELEDFQNLTSKAAYVRKLMSAPDQLEVTKCLSFLVGCIQLYEDEDHLKLTGRAIRILLNFSHNDSVRKMLHETFDLCPLLVEQVEAKKRNSEDPVLIDSLQLLMKLTYGQRIGYDQSYVSGLLRFLISNIMSKTETLLSPSLGTLANLCRNNVLIQSAIRNMSQFGKLQKTLCGLFEHSNQLIVVFSLSIFTSLSLQDSFGQEVFFAGSNVEQTLQTISNILKNNFRGAAWKYAADLLSDLLRHPKMQKCIAKYRYLSKCINDVLSLLATNTPDSVSEVFQLLTSICTVPSIRKVVNQTLFSPAAQNHILSKSITDVAKHSLAPDAEPLLCCLHWSCHEPTSSNTNNLSISALEFLSDSVQDCLCDTDSSFPIHVVVKTLISLLGKTCYGVSSQSQSSEKNFGVSTQKIIKLVKLIIVMCSDPESKSAVAELITVEMLSTAVESHLALNYLTFAEAMSDLSPEKGKSKAEITECVLLLLDLALRLRKTVPELVGYIDMVLQNPRFLDFQALGLTSTDQELVSISIKLIMYASPNQEAHPDLDLCGAIASLNKAKTRPEESKRSEHEQSQYNLKERNSFASENKENKHQALLSRSVDTNCSDESSNFDKSMESRLQRDEASLQKLIAKMETSIEGKKDLKTADVIDVFEHRIRAQQIQVEHQNDLLEAKSLALTQADRVISQLRAAQITHGAEMKKLQNLLKESYKRHEQLVTQMNDMRMATEKLQSQFDKQVEDKSEKIDVLVKENAEIVDKCSELEDKLVASKQEIKSISVMKDDLQKAHEKLNEQYKLSCSQSKQLDEERKTLSKHLKEKDASLLKMTTTLEALQSKHNNTEKERTELEKEKEEMETYVEELRNKLNHGEKECKQLQQTVNMLDQINQEQTTKLNDTTKQVKDLEAELEKHSQIVSFIHTLNLKTDGAKK